MFKQSLFKLIFVSALVFLGVTVKAGVIPFNATIKAKYTPTLVPVTVGSNSTVSVSPMTDPLFNDVSVLNFVTFSVRDSSAYIPTTGNVIVGLKVESFNKNNVLTSTDYPSLEIKYQPFPSTGLPYVDKSVKKYTGGYRIKVTVQSMTVNSVAVTSLPVNLVITSDIIVERYINFVPNISNLISMNTPSVVDLDCDFINDEMEIKWATLTGAEEYQLEWTFVNDYDKDPLANKPASALSFDFRNNSTRITTIKTSYKINLNFEHGYIIYRVRGIGRDFTNTSVPLPGAWNVVNSGLVSSVSSSNVYQVNAHERNKNWQYSATYAEEGKKKEVISYFDGSLRNRQTVTKINTDTSVVVGETTYDHQGRPAINILPAPVSLPECGSKTPGLRYYRDFNTSAETAGEYSRVDFDVDKAGDSCSTKLNKMNSGIGSSRYYSPNNSERYFPNADLLPDAKEYPFSQTEYTPDNTGRIRRQGGVGGKFQLDSTHATRYYYGSPTQQQLDRLFGSEVGDASHYKKNVVVDANEQFSITYLDQEGRTVATALAGDGPAYLDTLLTPNKNTGLLNVDLLNKDLNGSSKKNTVNIQRDAIEFGTPILVSFPNTFVFNYDIKIAQFPSGCLKAGVCFNCIYDLEILVKDDCGKVVTASGGVNPVQKMIGRFTADGSGNFLSFNTTCVAGDYTNAQTFTLSLTPGNYMITKKLTVNKDAKDYYLSNYFETTNTPVQGTYVNLNGGCGIKTYQQFVNAALTKIDTSDCNISCATCVASLKGTYATIELARDGFVADGKGTELDFDYLIEQCNSPCKEIGVCEGGYNMMLMDVTPDGQYGEYKPRLDGTPADMNLSVYNIGNRLPKNGVNTPNYKNPSIVINGNTYKVYIDKNGVRTKINVAPKSPANLSQGYTPEVDDNSLVKYDASTQSYVTYPENLKYLADFISRWDDNWAKSLVIYHPEYPYYVSCLANTRKYVNYNLTSDAFDSVLVSCQTFAQAQSVNYRLLSTTISSDMILFNKASQIVQDPFAFNTNFGTYSDLLNAQILNYRNTGLKMQEYAAKVARCGTMYGVTSPSISCTSFGTGSNTTILNNEWNILKNLYLSTKRELQKLKDESYARSQKAYNGCFGNPNFDPVTSGMLSSPPSSSPFANILDKEPCGYWLKQFYVDKKKRFGINNAENADLPTKEENDYQMYLQTGQTPMERNVQGLLNKLANVNQLTNLSNQALQDHTEFTQDLYVAVTGSLPSSYIPYFWKATSVGTSLSAQINDGSIAKSLFTFSKSSSAFTWADVKGISQFKYTGGAGPTYNFKAVAAVPNSIGSIRPYTFYDITGTTNFVLNNYNPSPSTLSKCKPNQLALDLANLWTAIALNGNINSATEITLNATDYASFITPSIKNTLGTTSTSLKWKYVSGSPNKYQLYDVSTKKIVMQIDSGNTTNFAYFHYMKNLDTPNGNAFRVTGKNTSGADVGKMKGSINMDNNSVITPISLGDCGLPENVLCTGNEYQTVKDVLKLLKSVMLPKPFNTNPDLTKSPAYTPLLESYLGSSIQSSTTKYDYLTLNAFNDYKEQIIYNMVCKCEIKLSHKGKGNQIVKFMDLSSLDSLKPYGPANIDNNKYKFHLFASYTYMSTTVRDTIFGESCFPMRNCDKKYSVDTVFSPVKPYVNPCIMNQLNIAALNAQNEFKKYKDSLTTDIAARYTQHCLGSLENLKMVYRDKEYHYTLYYYDQAGNLVKTIPPEGVELDTAFFAILKDRTLNRHDHFTSHRMVTTYTYNSLNQLVRQNVPDHDQMDVWEYTLSNGLDNRLKVTATQFVSATKGYLSGSIDALGRGLLYTTDDGGVTWTRMRNMVASDLKKVQMVSATIGYAVGKNGTVLKTLDGGTTWDMLTVPTTSTINDLHFSTAQSPTPLNGIIIGENNAIFITLNGGTSWQTTSNGFNLTDSLRTGSSLTSITNDGGYLFMTGNVNGSGYIYRAAVNSFVTGSFNISLPWTRLSPVSNTGVRTTDVIKVNMVDAKRGFAICKDGNLVKTTDGGSNWFCVPSGVTGEFRDIAFVKMNGLLSNPLNGVAIIDSIPGKGLLYQTNDGGFTWKQLSLNDGNYYNSVYMLQDFAYRDRGYAVGSLIKRIVYKNNNFVLVNVPVPTTALLDLKTVFFSDPNNGWVASASVAYYTKNGMASAPVWTAVSFSGFNIKKIYFGNSQNSGIALAGDGSVYKITPNLGTYLFTKISTTEYYMDINTSFTHVYALNKLGSPSIIRSVSKANVASASSLTALTGSGGMTSTNAAALSTFDVDSAGSVILAGGADGRLFKGSATLTTTVWNDYSRRVTPVPLYDIESPGAGTIMAVGADGNLLQCTDRNTYRVIPTKSAVQYNAIKFNKNGYNTLAAVKGLIAGNGGSLTSINITASTLITMAPVRSVTTVDLNDIAVKDNGGISNAFVAGSGGTMISIPNLDYPVPVIASPKIADDFRGIAFSSSGMDVFAVGNNTAIYNYSGTSGAKVNGIYTPSLYDVSFVNERNGYTIGDRNTIRYTSDGGTTWRYVPRTSTAVMNAVATYLPGRAVIVGASGYVGRTDTTTVVDSTVTGTYYDVSFAGSGGYMVGTSALKLTITSNLKLKYSATTGFPASTTFRAVHLFRNGSCMAAGDAGKIYSYYNNSSWVSFPLPGGITPALKDIFFHDDRNGYVVGDAGIIYRWLSPNDASSYSSAPTPNPWLVLSLSGTNGAANPLLTNLTNIAFADRYKGFIGGYATSGTINFARVVNDESKLFTSRFWYDALGRMVLSQNTKQYNRKGLSTQSGRSDYSYTFYDNLGRIVEVGEKTDNSSGTVFAGIFGDYVNGNYNPYVINALNFSNWANTGSSRREVTHTYYDAPPTQVPTAGGQVNLRKRVATVSYEGVNDGNPVSYDYASYYSYDIHGNVKTLWQHNNTLSMSVPTQMIKRIDYEYDLISGKVNLVRYQDGAADCFYHFYVYDGDNRITDVYTSNYPWNNQQINSRLVEKNPLWSREAKYFYYAHGPLARVEVGEFMSQGIDYAYTLQGWLKGVNSDALDPGRDMGKDGAGTGTHTMVGRDAFGYSLNYYAGDYAAIESTRWSTLTNRFESGRIGSQLFGARSDLYNGNISAMVTNISQPKSYSSAANEFPTYQAQGGAYKYDKLNRIKQSLYYQNLNTTTNQWNTSGLNPARYLNTFLYDGNGNITHQYRLNGGGGQLDSLSYKYKRDASGKLLSNRLNYVTDAAPSGTATDDLETQVSTNYGYDEMGNLQKDEWEQIDTIKWNVYGKIKSIRRATASIKSNFEFVYDGSGNRVAKIEKPDGTAKENGPSDQPLQWKITYYVRDAQGNIMGNYYYTNSGGLASYKLLERNIYGSSRLGTENTQIEMIGAPGAASPFTRTLGNKYFEGSNHLGNVLCIFTDKKIPRDDNSNQIIDYYQPEVLASNDYTVFGAPMQGRTFNSGNYRYGFNGKEKDDEVVGNGNRYDFDKRIYDPRLGRFLSIDPLTRDYPWSSPYVFAANNPIRFIDIAGMGPGDVFKTPEEAAIDFGKSYNDNSIGAKKEYATTIIKVTTAKGVYYSYVQPSIGNEASSRPSTRGLAGQETVARAHTHGSYSPKYDNEVFSPADINNATNQNVDSYVATPGGTLQKFEVATKNITTIATDIPSDPNSPANERVNKIDPVPLPKNEPTYGTWEFIKHNILTPLLEGAGTIQNKAPGSNKQETSPGQQDSPAADQQDTSDDEFQRPSK